MSNIKLLSCGVVLSVMAIQATPAMDLSFNDAVQKIMTESQDIKKADANLKKAQATLDSVNANRWFKVEGSATYMNMVDVERPFSGKGFSLPTELGGLLEHASGGAVKNIAMPDNIFMAGVTVTQPIYTFGKIGYAVDSVRSAVKISESSKEMARREVRYAAANMYWTAKMTDGIVKISEKSLADTTEAKRKLTSAGRANRSNLVKIEADIATKEISLSDAKFNRDTAHRMLKILSGIDVNEPLVLTDDLPAKFNTTAASDTLKSNPEWDILDQQVKMYEASALSKRFGNMPTLAATGSYNFIASHTDMNVFDGNKSQSAYWGLALQVPIFDGGLNRANATIDAMNAESVRQDLDKSKKMKSEEYNTAVQRYEHLRNNMESLENARNLAEKAYGISRDRFAAGQTSAVELSEVSSALSQLDMALLNAKYNILMSAESIKKLGE